MADLDPAAIAHLTTHGPPDWRWTKLPKPLREAAGSDYESDGEGRDEWCAEARVEDLVRVRANPSPNPNQVLHAREMREAKQRQD